MREYVMGLLALTVCICIIDLLLPAGEGIARHIKLLSSLCLLLALIYPMAQLLNDGVDLTARLEDYLSEWLDEGEQERQDFFELWEEQSQSLDIEYASEVIVSMLAEKFSLDATEVRVEVIPDAAREYISELRIALSGQAIWVNTHQMEAFVRETFGCESSIFIE